MDNERRNGTDRRTDIKKTLDSFSDLVVEDIDNILATNEDINSVLKTGININLKIDSEGTTIWIGERKEAK